ncbi:MAG: S8 family serine peptidase [Cryobacterium sp.]|nr:S8 family serine peptidase [Cryobacterium sp.]
MRVLVPRPRLADGSDILKPDISAPGVTPSSRTARTRRVKAPTFQFLSGTSMAAPHITPASRPCTSASRRSHPRRRSSRPMMTTAWRSTATETR